jgi:hypothetical protein
MATPIYLVSTETTPYDSVNTTAVEDGQIRDALRATKSGAFQARMDATAGGTEIRAYLSDPALGSVAWYSERIAAEVTISGAITVAVYAKISVSTVNARLRFKLWKRTAGGSEIDTFIGQGDGDAALTITTALHTLTITPPTAITLAPEERLIVRVYAIPSAGQTMDVGLVTMFYNGTVAQSAEAKLTFTETLTFFNNQTTLYLRSSQTIGVGSFYDLLPAQGSATTWATVAVNGAEQQWTIAPGATYAKDFVGIGFADTTNATTYTSGGFVPELNRLYLLAVLHSDAAPEATVPTITTDTGLNFVQIATVPFNTIASNVHRLTLFRAMKASGVAFGTVTVNLADAATGCCFHLTEVDGVVATGTDGADAVRNIVTGSVNAGANPSITLASFANAANGTYACFGSDIATVPTAGSGFTTLLHTTYSTPTTGLFTEWNTANDTTVDCTIASSDWGGVALELVAAAAGSPLEWITKRFRDGFTLRPVTGSYSCRFDAHESNSLANATPRLKLFRWRDGVETEFLNVKHPSFELLLGVATGVNITSEIAGQLTQMDFSPDDRLVLRLFATNAAALTLGTGYTATVRYNNVSPDTTSLTLLQTATFKEESDPAETGVIPDGLSMGGIGN